MNRANRLESQQFHTPCYCLPRIDFRRDDSTLQETIRDELGESSINSHFHGYWLPVVQIDSVRMESNRKFLTRINPSLSSRFKNEKRSSIIISRLVRIDSVRIESNRWVRHANRLKFVVTFKERETFIYHYFTGLDFRWCASTPCESSRIVKYLRRIDSSWVYWTCMFILNNKRDAKNQFNKSKRRESWRHWTIRTTLTKATYGKYATRVPDEVAYGIYEWFSSQ